MTTWFYFKLPIIYLPGQIQWFSTSTSSLHCQNSKLYQLNFYLTLFSPWYPCSHFSRILIFYDIHIFLIFMWLFSNTQLLCGLGFLMVQFSNEMFFRISFGFYALPTNILLLLLWIVYFYIIWCYGIIRFKLHSLLCYTPCNTKNSADPILLWCSSIILYLHDYH